jgi:hypothetical protein
VWTEPRAIKVARGIWYATGSQAQGKFE